MLQSIEGYYIAVTTSRVAATYPAYKTISFTYPGFDGPLPPGRTVFASIALSSCETQDTADPSSATAWITQWTVYNPDGTQSGPIRPAIDELDQNSVRVDNCATITFVLFAVNATARAQITVFVFY